MPKKFASQSQSLASRKFSTISQAAKRLGIAKGTLHNWLAKGKISSLTNKDGVNLFTDEVIAAAQTSFTPEVGTSFTSGVGAAAKKPLVSISQAAKTLGVSKGTLLRWE